MRVIVLALLTVVLGTAYYKLGLPSVRAYPAGQGQTVVKMTLSRMPGFVAYWRTGGKQVDTLDA